MNSKKNDREAMETIWKLREIDPDIKPVVATGYLTHPVLTDYRQYGFCGDTAKPFTMDELYKTVRELLKS
jgi:DNA-binding NtrC family response regulator